MLRWQFILVLGEEGFTVHFIGEVMALRDRERAAGIRRRWKEYIPGWR